MLEQRMEQMLRENEERDWEKMKVDELGMVTEKW
jgi:hypothetical protein